MKRRVLCLIAVTALIFALAPAAAAANVKLMAITFDDGPSAVYTPKLLDGLKERGVKATFFLCGSMAQYNKDLVLRTYEEGHQIANHTWSHPALTGLSDARIRDEVFGTADLLTEITGLTDFFVRPPYGSVNPRVAGIVNLPLIMWSVDPTNGKYPVAQSVLTSRLISSAHDGAIILMHDTTSAYINSALDAIDALHEKGYEFVTLNELFRLKGMSPGNGEVYYKLIAGDLSSFDESRLDEHWAASDIRFVREAGIMDSDGTGFGPNRPMTRAMAVTALWRMAGSPAGGSEEIPPPLADFAPESKSESEDGPAPEPEPGDEPESEPGDETDIVAGFADVFAGRWYSDAVEWGRGNGIVNGLSEDLFGTDDYITREQFFAMLERFSLRIGAGLAPAGEAARYGDDARISGWALDSVMQIRSAGFASKNDVELFRPRDDVTRAEAAELIAWYMTPA